MNKKAFSNVVTTLIIMALVLVAIGVVWSLVKNITDGEISSSHSDKLSENYLWEEIETWSSKPGKPNYYTYRASVPDGWVVAITNNQGVSLTYIPDPYHKWEIPNG